MPGSKRLPAAAATALGLWRRWSPATGGMTGWPEPARRATVGERDAAATGAGTNGREDEIARKVLVRHLTEGNSYGTVLKSIHCKFPQVELGPWVEDSPIVGADWKRQVLEGWEAPQGH